MLNSIGIPSAGAERFIAEDLPRLRAAGPPVIVSIAEESVDSFRRLARMIEATGMADLLELDLSCPNVHTGAQWAGDPVNLSRAVSAVADTVLLPVIAKLSPMVSDIAAMALAAEKAGARAVSLVNTFKGMVIDIESRRPVLGNVTGGLSGPAIRPIAVAAVWAAYEAVSIPIIGIGGVSCFRDAVEFMLAGATAVGVACTIS
jgi:dihydroorotate dehydrogenase (NAD+) catalytic subunit